MNMRRGGENLINVKVLEAIYRKIICLAISFSQKNVFKGVLTAINAGKNL